MKIVIFGQYKTGTTALFYRVKHSLTGEVRTLFEPPKYVSMPDDEHRNVLAKVMLVMPESAETVCYDSFRGFEKKLYLTRDPRDWLVSGALFLIQQTPALYRDEARLNAVLGLLRDKERNPSSVPLLAVFTEILRGIPGSSLAALTDWMQHYHQWLFRFENSLSNALRVRYEDCVDGRLDAVAHYLGFPLNGAAEVAPEHDHVPRAKRYGDWQDWLVPEDVICFAPVFDAYLRHYGYLTDWTLNHTPRIAPEHCSLYVERVVNKRKAAEQHLP